MLRKNLNKVTAKTTAELNKAKEKVKEQYNKANDNVKQNGKIKNVLINDNVAVYRTSIGFFILGAFTAIIAFGLTFNIVWNLMDTPCYNNCNTPHGYCNENNVCICTSPVHSGRSCEFSACDTCNQNSTCAPYLMTMNIKFFCRWENPTPENNFRVSTYGWQNPQCQQYLSELRLKRWTLLEKLTEEESNSFPQCLCEAPWSGQNCEVLYAPQNAALKICSGNGNKTVGLFNNDTITGDGAQCKYPFRLLDYAITEELAVYITNAYPTLLWKEYCGRLIYTNDSFYIENFEEDVGCFCSEDYEGSICQFGKCEIGNNGLICSGKGAPNLGLGLEYNTTIIKSKDNCYPICEAGYTYCQNERLCKNITETPCSRVVCDVNTPYRCRDESCVSGESVFVNGEQGYREYFNNPRVFVTNDTVTQLLLSSKLISVIFDSGEVTYFNTTYTSSFIINDTLQFNSILEITFNVFSNYFIETTADGGRITVLHLNGDSSLIDLSTGTPGTIFGDSLVDFFITNPLTGNYYTIQNTEATVEYCLSATNDCLFTFNGTNYSPFDVSGGIAQGIIKNVRPYLLLYGPELTEGDTYYLSTPINADISMYIFAPSGTSIKYYLQEDLVKPSICSPYQTAIIYFENSDNQSYYNELYYSDTSRSNNVSLFTYGDHLVYYSFIMNNWERGVYIGDKRILNEFKANIIEENVEFARLIKKEEYNLYLVECPSFLSYYNQKCVWPQLYQNTHNTTCVCTSLTNVLSNVLPTNGIPCECKDGSLVNTDENVQCELFANGIYKELRYIYRPGNFTVNDFNGLVFYDDNITEVYYGNFSSFYTNYILNDTLLDGWLVGGYFPNGWLINNVVRTASSNSAAVNNTNSSTFTYWYADESDRNVFIEITSPVSERITSVLIHIRNNTIKIGNLTIIIPIYLEADGDVKRDITSDLNEQIINLSYPSSRVKLSSPYPFAIYEFAAFTNQNCSSAPSTIIFGIDRNTRNESLVDQQLNITDGATPTNITDMFYLNYSFVIDKQITIKDIKINVNTCYLKYLCNSGKCSSEECLTYYNCNGNGCIQPDTRIKYFKCACKEGYSGFKCEYKVCRPSINGITEFELQTPDPHTFCSCGYPNPLKFKPSRNNLAREKNLNTLKLLELNRLGMKRLNSLDVSNLYIRSEAAPYGVPIIVKRKTKSNVEIYSNCPYAHKGPNGQYLTLEDDVETRGKTGLVTKWRDYYDYELKRNVTYVWENEYSYDEFPYRCPNGECVSGSEYCLSSDLCNGHGTCRVDGTCSCSIGWTTFLYTSNSTITKRIPYYWDGRNNITNPSIWGITNNNARDFGIDWCMAKDCTVTDCSVDALKGCFPGTPPNFFDRQIICQGGGCAANAAACVRGEQIPALNCSGNGLIRKRDYRDEYYCDCGYDLIEKNGFGGPLCDRYTCDEGLNKKFSQYDRRTKTPYYDKSGRIKRGLWLGYCGVHIGPDPNELDIWQNACFNFPSLETCSYVPCLINGQIQSVLAEECIPSGGTPKVYPCNNHGTPRADGTCECDRDENKGTGYVPDITIGEDNNCFQKIECPISPVSNTPCNSMSFCSDPKVWILPPSQPYFNDQIDILLNRIGYSLSNESVIDSISNQQELANQKLAAYVQVALEVKQAIKDVATCICILSVNDTNNTFPLGMVPYSASAALIIQPYQKAFESPYLLNYYNYTKLSDGIVTFLNFSDLINNTDYLQLPLGGGAINLTLANKIFAIRVHARGYNLPNQTIRFYSGNVQICPVLIIDNIKWDWYEQYCDSIYKDFDYFTVNNYVTTCVLNDDIELCEEFKEANCPGQYQPINQLFTLPRGCKTSCCILISQGFSDDYLTNITIRVDNTNAIIAIDQLQLYGYGEEVIKPVPDFLFSKTEQKSSNCSLRPDVRYAQQLLGDDKSYYYNGQSMNYTEGLAYCKSTGGYLATPISEAGDEDFSFSLAQACGGTKCLINGYDLTKLLRLQNISQLIEPSCTAWGCYFEATSYLDIMSARNSSIYLTQWVNNIQTWGYVVNLYNNLRFDLNQNNPISVTSSNDIQFFNRLNPYIANNIYNSIWDVYLDFTPTGDNYSPYVFISLNQVQYTPDKLNPLFGTYDPSYKTFIEKTARVISFLPQKALFSLFGYACTGTIRFPSGYCGITNKESFPFEFFGVDIISYLRNTYGTVYNIPGIATSFESCFNLFSVSSPFVPLYENIKSISIYNSLNINSTNSEPVVLFLRVFNTTSNTEYEIVVRDLLFTKYYNVPVTLLVRGVRVIPAYLVDNPSLKLRKYEFNIQVEPFDSHPNVNARDYTMGYIDKPYMGVRIRTKQIVEIGWDYMKIDLNQTQYDQYRFLNWTSLYRYNVTNIQSSVQYTDPSVYIAEPGSSSLTFFNISALVSTSTLGRPIVSCDLCELKNRSFYSFFVNTYTNIGGFPKQFTATKDAGIVIYKVPAPYGTVRLDEMPFNSQLWRWYVRQSVVNLEVDYLKNFGKDWCIAINAVTAKYEPVPCDLKYPVVCIRDYTKYVAQSGRTCDVCDYSSRSGGVATGGKTCLDGFPLANSTLFPFEHFILQQYDAGTLNIYLQNNNYDYDKARLFYMRNNKPIVWALSDAWDLWNGDSVDRPGFAVNSNSYNWLDFSLDKHYSYDCGAKYSQKTGIIYQMCARDISFCDPDAVYPLVRLVNPPNILLPILEPSPKIPLCGIVVRPVNYVTRDRLGGRTPEDLTIIKKEFDGVVQILLPYNETTYFYNTGKPSNIYEGVLTFYGTFTFSAIPTLNSGFNMWVSPLTPTYLYPSSKIVIINNQTFNTDSLITEFFVNVTITQNATYQSLGFDFINNGLDDLLITISNIIVSTNDTLLKCSKGNSQPRYEPYPSVVSTVPNNQCIYSKTDLLFFKKNKNVGECACAPMFGGPSCDCPAINRVPCGGAYGTCYDTNKCACQNIGTLFYEKLLLFGTSDYFKVYIQDTDYNDFAFTLVKNDSIIRTLTETEALALTTATTLPSFINGDELDDFLTINTVKPLFVDLTREGNEDIVWTNRGHLYDYSSLILLGGEYPVLNQQNWTLPMIEALNFDNLAFNITDVLYDGSIIWYSNISTVTVIPEPITTTNLFVFAESANCTSSNCVKTSTLYHWICSAGITSFDTFNISEIQVYDIGTISLYF
jgi:hypothetical protein